MAVVDEKIAKVTLDNRAFTDNAKETIKSLERLKQAFTKVSAGSKDSKNIEKNMTEMTTTISKSVNKSESLLSKLRSIFKKSTSNIDMSGASSSIDKMNTDIANKTAKTSDILSRLKGIFQKADNSEGFPNTVAAIDKLNGKVGSFDASPLSSAFQSAAIQVQNSISIMDIALGNFIANGMTKMVSFGKQFVSGPLDGFAEYANKMTSIQTIKSNTEAAFGGDINRQMVQINRTLSDLNNYADQTIYSFEDMTRNIGTFTAAGVGLEDSAVAIKGIANLAAASGSSSMQASTAMYQLSQALASGKVSLMDWNSVVNAGMGGELFKNALYETADALGTNRDKTKTFRDSLQDGWLTAEVLLETLKKFSTNESMLDAATKVKTFRELIDTTKEAIGSGWSETWEHVFGGLEEAKGLWSDVSKEIGAFLDDNQGIYFDQTLQMERNLGNFRNAVLKTWKDNGGQQAFFDSIKNSVGFLMQSMASVREGFRSAFGDYQTVAAKLVIITQSFAKFTEALKNNQVIQESLKSVGSALGNTFKTLGMIFGSLFKGVSKGNSGMNSLVKTIESISQGITSFMQAIQQNQNIMQGFTNIGKIIGNVFGIVFRLFSMGAKIIGQFFSTFDLGRGGGSGFASFTDILADITDGIIKFLDWINQAIDKVGLFKAIGMAFSETFKFIGETISSVFDMMPGNNESNPLSGFIEFVKDEFNDFVNKLKSWGSELSSIGSKLGGIMSTLFEGLKNGVSKGYETFKQVFSDLQVGDIIKGLIGLFALNKWIDMKSSGEGVISKFINKLVDGLKNSLEWVKEDAESFVDKAGNILDNFGNSVSAFTNMINVTSLAIIAAGILAIAVSIKMLSELEMEDLSKGMIGIGTSVGVLVFAFQKLTALSKGFQKGTATTMIAFSFALVILVKAMKTASEIDSDKLGTSVQGIVAAALTLVGSMKLLQGTKGMQGGIMQLVGVALAMKILASALYKLKDFDPNSLMYATTSMVGLMMTLVGGVKLLDGVKIHMRTMTSLISFAIAARILVSSLNNIAAIDPERLIPAVGSLLVLMTSLAGITRIMNNVKIKMGTILSLITFSLALRSLVKSVEQIASINPRRLEPAVYSVMGLLSTLALSTKIISKSNVSLSALASIITFTKSLEFLVGSVEALAKIKPERLIPSVVALGGMLTALVLATYAVQGAKPKPGAIFALLSFSAGVLMLAKSVKEIADLDTDHLTRGMLGVSGLMVTVVGASYAINNMKFNLGSMIQMITLTASVKELVSSVKKIADMNPTSMVSGMAGVSLIMLSLASSVRIVNSTKAGIGTAIINLFTIQTFSETIMQIGLALQRLAKIPWKKLTAATAALAIVMSMLVGLMAMSDKLNGDIGELATLALVLYVASKSLARIAQFDWQSIVAATAMLVTTIGSVVVAMKLMSGMSFSGSGQLLVVSAALLLLSVSIKSLAGVGIIPAAIGLGVLAANLGLVLAAAAVAQLVAPGLMLLSTTIRSLGISSLLAATSFTIASVGIAAITFAVAQLAATAPSAFKQLVEGFVVFITTLAKNSPTIVDSLVKTVRQALRGMKELLPDFITFGIDVVTNLLKGLAKSMPQLVEAAVNFIVEFGKALVENAVILVQTSVQLLEQLLVGMLDALPSLIGLVADIAVKFMDLLATELEKHTPKLVEGFTRILRQVVQFITPLITEIFGPLFNTIVETLEPGLRKIIDLIVELAPVLVPLIQAISDTIQVVADGIVRIVEAVVPHISPILDSITRMIHELAPIVISLFNTIASVIQTVAPVAIALIDGIVVVVQTLGTVVLGVIDGIVAAINAVGGVITAVGAAITSIVQAIGSAFESAGIAIKTALEGVGGVIESVGETIKTVLEGAGEVVESVGESIKTALEGVGQVFKDIGSSIREVCTGISEVVDSIGGAISGVLDSVAGIFESMGNAALKAGRGFKMVGEGVSEIVQYSLGELVTNLGAVADVIIKISNNSEGISSAGKSFKQIGQGLTSVTESGIPAGKILTNLSTAIPVITQAVTPLPAALQQVASGFQAFGGGLQNGIMMAIPMAIAGLQKLVMTVQTTSVSLQTQGLVLGQSFGASIGTGIAAGVPSVQMSAMMLGQGAKMAVQTNLNPGVAIIIGGQFGQGFGAGIATGIPAAQMSAMMLGQGAQMAAQASLNPGVSTSVGAQFGNGIASGISSQSGAVNATASALSQGAVNSIRGGFAPAPSIGSTFAGSIRNGISSQIGATNSVSRNLAQGSVNAVRGGFAPANSLGSKFGSQVAAGVRGQSGNVSNAGSSIARSGQSGVQSISWHSSGVYLGQGLANGINSMSGHVMAVASNLAARAASAIKRALDIRSPSRVTYSFGEFFSEGFINGIVSLVGQAVKTSTTLAEKTADAIAGTGEMIESEFSNNLDFNPTITPVVDLSNMRKLDNIYNGEYSLGMRTSHSIDPRHYRNQNAVTNSTTNNTNEYQYEINVNVSGSNSVNAREIAREVQAEIKRMNDRAKIGRGEQPVW